MNNTGEFSIREKTSINSNQFFNAAGSRNPAAITIIGNTVIDPIITAAITIGNQGPVTFINNVVRSRPAVTFGPVVVFKCQGNADSFSMGNTFNVANAISTDDNNIVYDNKVVSSEKLKNLGEPKLPGTEPNYHRRIFEVPIGADAAAIQSIINMAASAQAKRPVVHFPYGIFNITSTLVIPANAAIQLIGDGFGNEHATVLQWTGSTAGPILLLTGPSKVMIQDMTFKGKSGITNIRVDNADQKGARVFLQEFNQSGGETGLSVDQLDHTMVFAYDTQFSGMKKAISVTGGPLALNDKPTEGRTIIYSGAESNNMVSHEVSNGGNLIVQDSWYEGGIKSTYAKLSGKCIFTADGDHISTPQHTDVPSVIVDNFSGKALFLGDDLTDRFSISGNGLQSKILAIGMLTEDDPAISDTSSPKADMRLLLSRTRNYGSKIIQGGSYPIANIGGYNQSYFYEMLRSMLQVHSITLSALPANTTDIRFYRVMSINGSYGLHITGLK